MRAKEMIEHDVLQEKYDEGYDGAFTNATNPYPEGSAYANEWDMGYDAATQHIAESERELLDLDESDFGDGLMGVDNSEYFE